MRKLFVGLLFLFIDYNIGSVSVTPGFVGYLLFWAGMGEVECTTFTRVRPLTLAMAGASALIWVRSFFSGAFDVVGLLLMVVTLMLQLAATRWLVQGLSELQASHGADLKARNLLTGWNIMAIGSVCVCVFRMVAYSFAQAALLLYFGGAVYYVVLFYQAGRAYQRVRT